MNPRARSLGFVSIPYGRRLGRSENEWLEHLWRIRALLHERFNFLERADEALWSVYEVYRRR